MSDRDFQAEFDELMKEFVAARRAAAEKDSVDTPETIAQAETARANWRIVKEQIKDLLDEWVETGGLTSRQPG